MLRRYKMAKRLNTFLSEETGLSIAGHGLGAQDY